jgi:hypothetical protein
MNSYLESNKQLSILCIPAKLGMDHHIYMNIIEAEIKGGAKQDIPVELLLLHGLIKTFPCGKSGAQ